MTGPLLETKLHVPRRRPGLVARPRLQGLLGRSADTPLALASAPAGFGKSTLLAAWVQAAEADGQLVAWVSLDERDNEPSMFWTYVITALQRAAPEVGGDALAMLTASRSAVESVLASLLNDLLAVRQRVVLILDDYHTIEAHQIHEQVGYLLEHLPAGAHVVIATRFDPPLPLARMRARRELLEVRAADLRFTDEEAATYLDSMNLGIEEVAIEMLVERTEGWIAALQLAALSMQGRDDVAGFITSFAGDDRFVVDYLVAEVLQRQPDALRDFLLRTSILRRMNGPLCDAVTGQGHGRETLETIERSNLFVVPLDDRRDWYRYHHLFAEMLRVRLQGEQPDLTRELHRRACHWHEQHQDLPEAIHHALAGEHHGQAADLIERAANPVRRARQEATLRRWLERLPDEVLRQRPVLSTILVGVLMASGEIDGVEERLADAERWLAQTEGPDAVDASDGTPVVIDEVEFRRLPSQIAVYRAGQARMHGDDAGTIRHALRAMDLAADDDHLGKGAASGLLALAHWTLGDLDGAHAHYSDAAASLQRAGHHSDVLGCTLALGDIRRAQGRLHGALSTYQHGLGLASARPGVLRGTADMHVGMAEVLLERNDIEGAIRQLDASTALGDHAHLPQHPYRHRVATAAVRAAQGDLDGALVLLDEAERIFDSDFSPPTRPVAAVRARLHLARGEVDEARAWVSTHELSVEDDLTYVREFEHITLASVLLAQHHRQRNDGSPHTATSLLERLLTAAEAGQRTGSIIEILVLQALANRAAGNEEQARAALDRAVALAEPEGFLRVFLDHGAALGDLLRTAIRDDQRGSHARLVVTALSARRVPSPPQHRPDGIGSMGPVEHLSDRELEVLRLLRSQLSGPEIARELHVSVNTLRTHTKHIYSKLGVNSRRAAVDRAAHLGL